MADPVRIIDLDEEVADPVSEGAVDMMICLWFFGSMIGNFQVFFNGFPWACA